jgi:hypothetical protein
MIYLNIENARVGMVVKLFAPSKTYTIGYGNPAVGTKFECTGRVVKVSHCQISVVWSNNNRNVYSDNELILCANEPNDQHLDSNCGSCINIWE